MLNTNWLSWKRFAARVLSFFLEEYFTDALRNTLVIVLPITKLFVRGHAQIAIGIRVGALLISLTDMPGNRSCCLAVMFSLGFWYYLVSLLQISIWPYKYLNHAIFECLTSTVRFLKAKARCYDTELQV